MRNGMRWILLVLIAGIMFFATSAMADSTGTCGDDLTWSLDNNGVLTISGTGDMTVYSYREVPWYSNRNDIQSVIVESGVNSLSIYAFRDCTALKTVTIEDGLTTIGDFAFYDCQTLESIVLPESLSSIGNSAFTLCKALAGITLPESLTTLGESAFSYCTAFTEITVPGGVTGIGRNAFNNCNGLTTVTIGNGVGEIGNYSFSNCSVLANITIPVSVTSISADAFSYCSSLHEIFYTGMGYEWYQISGASSTSFMNGKTIHCSDISLPVTSHGTCGASVYWYFEDNIHLIITGAGPMENYFSYSSTSPWYNWHDSITAVTIRSGVTTIGDFAFINCSNLTSITIPEGVTYIGEQALENCTSLTEINLPESLTSIGPGAFSYCTGLTEVTIPAGVTSVIIPFEGASSLTAIHVNEDSEALLSLDGVLYNKDKTTLIAYPAAKADTVFRIPDSVTSIADHAFEFASRLTSVTIPNGVSSIGTRAFLSCSALTEITLPAALSAVSNNTFTYCMNLTSVTIPSGVTSIGSAAFYVCMRLTDVYYTGSTSEWNDITIAAENDPLFSATLHCAGDSEAEVSGTCGDNLTWRLDDAGLLTISGSGDMTGYMFTNAPWYDYRDSIRSVLVANGVTSIGTYAFYYDYNYLSKVSLPESLKTIGAVAFFHCPLLTEITIPSGVTNIEPNAFAYDDGLTAIMVPAGVTKIGDGAFKGCKNLVSIDADENNPSFCSLNGVLYNRDMTEVVACPAGKSGTFSIPEGIIRINPCAFCECRRLTGITVPDSVTTIGSTAFSGCESLTSLVLPDGVTSLGVSAFEGCSSLTSFTIPDGVPSLELYAFYADTSMTKITIPVSVTSIGDYAFRDCSSLKDVYYTGSREQWNRITIGNYNTELTEATIHCSDSTEPAVMASGTCGEHLTWTLDDAGLLTISGTGNMTDFPMNGAPWFEYNSSILSAQIEEGVTGIGNYAFISLSSLADISLPESLVRIGAWSINGCRSLTSIAIPANVAEIDSNALSTNFKMTEIRVDPENACYSDVDGVLFDKNITTLINFPAGREGTYTIPDTVTTILHHSFCWAQKLTSVEIPVGVTVIGEHAFQACNKLTSITIPEGVTSIGEYSFSSCSRLESITLPASLTEIGMNAFNMTNLSDVYYGGSQIGWKQIDVAENNLPLLNATIHYAAESRILILPMDLATIGSAAFVNLPNVEAIRIPSSVTDIATDAFDSAVILIVPSEQWAQWAENNGYSWQLSE